ncbi:MAG: hypothetical protein AAF685_10065 [Cyanobacteria bacterium P01_C01_bin.89]
MTPYFLLSEDMNAMKVQRKRKFEKSGICNLCLSQGDLTKDHVPPKSSVKKPKGKVQSQRESTKAKVKKQRMNESSFFLRLTGNSRKLQPRFLQDGIYYQTLCGDCNNLLGSRYDDCLVDFSKSVRRVIEAKRIINFDTCRFRTQPARLVRAILGHLFAAKETNDDGRISENVLDPKIRDFLLDESATLPEEVHIFYWIHRAEEITLVRDFLMSVDQDFVFCWGILRYSPVAYIVCNSNRLEGLSELTLYRSLGIDDTATIPVQVNQKMSPNWPEDEDKYKPILLGKDAINGIYVESA